MSFSADKLVRSASPATSETSHSRAHRPVDAEADLLKKDKPFRKYAAGVERALGLFDHALQEWADYISFLSRLSKALQAQPEGLRVIPDKKVVARRLAQCLSPLLPSGVHQKALELYGLVFALQGKENLADDLALYLPGLSATLSFASLSVRPMYLSLIEDHILPLPVEVLRPALKAIILSLLPGLEEETSEDFDRVLDDLNMLKNIFWDSDAAGVFWQSLFLASITSPSKRLGVLAYLNRHLPKLGPKGVRAAGPVNGNSATHSSAADATAITDPEPGLLIRCFATGLTDPQLLVQREFLELLVTHLPLNASVFQEAVKSEDLRVLVVAATSVVLRRDMSLNKRLWTWYLGNDKHINVNAGSEPQSPEELNRRLSVSAPTMNSTYFSQYALEPLVTSLEDMIEAGAWNAAERAKPFRISLSLMDRWDIGGPVVTAVFLPLLRSLHHYENERASKDHMNEVLRSANVFFDGVESILIWSKLLELISFSGPGTDAVVDSRQDLGLAKFILTNFSLQEEEMLQVHIPLVTLALLCLLKEALDAAQSPSGPSAGGSLSLNADAFDVLVTLVNLLPQQVDDSLTQKDANTNPEHALSLSSSRIFDHIEKFYVHAQNNPGPSQPPFSRSAVRRYIAEITASSLTSILTSNLDQFQGLTSPLIALVSKVPRHDVLTTSDLPRSLLQISTDLLSDSLGWTYPRIAQLCSLTIDLCPENSPNVLSVEQLFEIVPALLERLWNLLSPSSPNCHVEAVRYIWGLQNRFEEYHLVESQILSLLTSSRTETTSEALVQRTPRICLSRARVERFSVLWNLSFVLGFITTSKRSILDPPLLLIIDHLTESNDDAYEEAWKWIRSTPSIVRVYEAVLSPIIISDPNHQNKWDMDVALTRLSSLLSAQSDEQWSTISREMATTLKSDPAQKQEAVQLLVARLCVEYIQQENLPKSSLKKSLEILRQLLRAQYTHPLASLQVHQVLLDLISRALRLDDAEAQGPLIDTLIAFTNAQSKLSIIHPGLKPGSQRRSKGIMQTASQTLLEAENTEVLAQGISSLSLMTQLIPCFKAATASRSARPILDKWMLLMRETIPKYDNGIFQALISLTESFCKEIAISFGKMQKKYSSDEVDSEENYDKSLTNLLNGLEFILAYAHQQLADDGPPAATPTSPESTQTTLNITGRTTSAAEGNLLRNSFANNRLTLVLCFQDTIKTCFSLWSWKGDEAQGLAERTGSFQHASSRLRNRSRRILENLLQAEALESVETLIEIWVIAVKKDLDSQAASVLSLFQSLNGTQPKATIPAIFNAIYSRTNPSALSKAQRSTLSTNLTESELVTFIVYYIQSLEDDILEEIWADCMTFLRDVLANPMPHRHVLARLLSLTVIIGQKMENTNFGEEWRMRRELGDVFMRLLAAVLTVKPMGLAPETTMSGRKAAPRTKLDQIAEQLRGSDDLVQILSDAMPTINQILGDSDKILGVITSISTQIIAPTIRSRNWPQTVTPDLLLLLQQICKIPNSSKTWKKDILDAFNDPRFFQSSPTTQANHWLALLAQATQSDKTLFPELLSRLTPPASAGLMFGVGANTARFEADKKTQLTLRRIAALVLAAGADAFDAHFDSLRSRIEESLTATRVSSPSSATRAEVFMLVRALSLYASTTSLATLWPVVVAELEDVFRSIRPDHAGDTYGGHALLQAAKLLDLLLLLRPDEFMLHAWLFVTDTVDAIYPPDGWRSAALADEVASAPSSAHSISSSLLPLSARAPGGAQRPWLCTDATRAVAELEVVPRLLLPFFRQLSIHAFESTYTLGAVDREACVGDLLKDLFDERTMVS